MKNLITRLGLIALLAGCVTAKELDDRLGRWVGQDADQLASAWGAPNGSYVKKDGSKILSYERTGIVTAAPTIAPDTFSRFCRVDITVDAGNVIRAAVWRGADEECAHVIAAPAAAP